MSEKKVELSKMVQELQLKPLFDLNFQEKIITSQDINRPGIQLTGFFEHYEANRVQIIGHVESEYLKQIDTSKKRAIYEQLLLTTVPCVIFCRDIKPDDLFVEVARKNKVPMFSVPTVTTIFMSKIIQWLNTNFAPEITIHGCLVDVYGVGLLIRGESGIGKSEAVLELIRRGHRLVADDAVDIRKINDEELYGRAPEITRDFIEIRGIGIVDLRSLYGFEVIKESQSVDVEVNLEEWDKGKVYDRLGMDDKYSVILGNKVPQYTIPVRPGRNLAVILEAVAVNYRQKKAGYNSVEVFIKRSRQQFKNDSN